MSEKKLNEKMVEELIELEKKSSKLSPLSKEEKSALGADDSFESVYFSNRLEGNNLTKEEAKNAILSDKR